MHLHKYTRFCLCWCNYLKKTNPEKKEKKSTKPKRDLSTYIKVQQDLLIPAPIKLSRAFDLKFEKFGNLWPANVVKLTIILLEPRCKKLFYHTDTHKKTNPRLSMLYAATTLKTNHLQTWLSSFGKHLLPSYCR